MNINSNTITTIMSRGTYGVCYEPIIRLDDMKILGYEALSRFKFAKEVISPADFFKSAHENIELFFYVETVLKKFQLQNRPKNKKLFLNLDPDVAIDANHTSFWVKLFNDKKDIVIEIIENSDEENAPDIENFMDWMDEYNLPYAYDDFAKPNSMFFESLFYRASIIKLDINLLKRIKQNSASMEVAKGIVKYAKKSHKYTVLEGVENEIDMELAKEMKVDYIQGYIFKKEFITVWKI